MVVLVRVDDKRRPVGIPQALLAGERQAGDHLHIGRAVRAGIEIGQVAVVRAFRVQEPVPARVVVDVAL